ncbi:energy transducer TonB [Desulfogranum mediterraneum]|uniref:energy transducer TonB n=1 Tax=Desulfogranum mediterraneum TaxID=160661 RepID=UPI000412EA5D|nr:energy transducer TonB [Desulfogranum mediterraneum]
MAEGPFDWSLASSHRLTTWLGASLATVSLNLVLFLLLPALMLPPGNAPSPLPLVERVQLVRLPPEEPPLHPKEEPPPPKPQPQAEQEPRQQAAPLEAPKLSLPFTLNPRMPAAPTDLQLPLVQAAPFHPGLADGVGMEELDGPLTTLARIPPVYPLRALRRGIEGWVRVRFLVDQQGQVGSIQVVAAEPAGVFEQSVLRCVAKWQYRPGTVEGVAVSAWMETTVRFALE